MIVDIEKILNNSGKEVGRYCAVHDVVCKHESTQTCFECGVYNGDPEKKTLFESRSKNMNYKEMTNEEIYEYAYGVYMAMNKV